MPKAKCTIISFSNTRNDFSDPWGIKNGYLIHVRNFDGQTLPHPTVYVNCPSVFKTKTLVEFTIFFSNFGGTLLVNKH